jgi:hypothetical protein
MLTVWAMYARVLRRVVTTNEALYDAVYHAVLLAEIVVRWPALGRQLRQRGHRGARRSTSLTA